METPRHPYRKFVFATASRAADGQHFALTGARHGRSIRLTPGEYELARLFDGGRDAGAVRAAAAQLLNLEIGAAELERFANDLAQSDLLAAGTHEPLPVPPQTDAEAVAAGWRGGPGSHQAPNVVPPSTVPGNLAGPGLPGSLTGLWGRFRGDRAPLRLGIPVRALLPLGMALALPVFSRVLLALTGLAFLGAVAVVWTHRLEMGRDFARLLSPLALMVTGIGIGYFVNFLVAVARAATVQNCTRTRPAFGINVGLGLIPYFMVDTAGAAEASDRGSRLRIVGSALIAQLVLFVVAVVAWLIFKGTASLIAPLAVAATLVLAIYFFVQINPLARRDGYNWLSQWYGGAELRGQALMSLFGSGNPWSKGQKLSIGTLRVYGVLAIAYAIWVVVWVLTIPGPLLQAHWGGAGVFVVVLLLGYTGWSAWRRTQSERSAIGGSLNLQLPNRLDWIIVVVLAVLALLPYPYEPSGAFTVLPNARADVRALTSGDVREVFVKEGDRVKAGQVIARVADDEERTAVAASQANLLRLQANLAIARAGGKPEEIEAAKQEVATASKKLQFSREEANRLDAAFKRNAVSAQDYQKALSIAEVNQQQLIEAQKRVTLVQSPARDDQIKAIEADIAREQAQLDYNQKQLDNAQIKAPIAGRVVSGSLRYAVGDYLERGKLLASVEDTSKLLVEIRVSENDVGEIKLGDKAYAKAWGFPNDSFGGVVTEIAPIAEKGDYGRVVRVLMTIEQPDGRLKSEMTGYAKVSVATYPLIVAYTRPVIRFLFVEIWSWLP